MWLAGRKRAGKYMGKCAKTVAKYEREYGLPSITLPSGQKMFNSDEIDKFYKRFSQGNTDSVVQEILNDVVTNG